MSNGPSDLDVVLTRLYVRTFFACMLVVALVVVIWMLVTELNAEDSSGAMIALLGTGVGAIGSTLGSVAASIAGSDKQERFNGTD